MWGNQGRILIRVLMTETRNQNPPHFSFLERDTFPIAQQALSFSF